MYVICGGLRPRCMQPTTATTTTTWCWIWAAVSHSWELCLAGRTELDKNRFWAVAHLARAVAIQTCGHEAFIHLKAVCPSAKQRRAAPSSGRLQLQILSDSIQPYVERAARRTRGKIEELNHYGSKLKSLSCYMFWCWKTIFLMQWRTFVTLWCFHDTHVRYTIRRVNICYNYLKCVLTFSTKNIYFVQ